MNETLILLKPDTLERKLVGKIISRFEDRGFVIEQMKMVWPTWTQINEHYSHMSEDILKEIGYYMVEKPCIAMVLSGIGALWGCKIMVGATEPLQAGPGTIRGDFSADCIADRHLEPSGQKALRNIIHCSDSVEAYENELCIWFPELCTSGDELNF